MNHFFRPVLKSLKKAVLLLPMFLILLFLWGSDPKYVEYDGWSALASVFCVIRNPADENFLDVLMGLVPYVVFLFLFSQEYREDFVISYCYVFTRYRGRGTWALQKVDYHPKRVLPEAMKDPYYALGDSTVGIYEISDRVQTGPVEKGTTLATLPEDALILTWDQEELDLYNRFRQDALAWLQEAS